VLGSGSGPYAEVDFSVSDGFTLQIRSKVFMILEIHSSIK
jgi:hypothetical protein